MHPSPTRSNNKVPQSNTVWARSQLGAFPSETRLGQHTTNRPVHQHRSIVPSFHRSINHAFIQSFERGSDNLESPDPSLSFPTTFRSKPHKRVYQLIDILHPLSPAKKPTNQPTNHGRPTIADETTELQISSTVCQDRLVLAPGATFCFEQHSQQKV